MLRLPRLLNRTQSVLVSQRLSIPLRPQLRLFSQGLEDQGNILPDTVDPSDPIYQVNPPDVPLR